MNNLKKIGLSALAGSLVAFSANAGSMSVSGSAGLYMSSADDTAKTTFSNSDHVSFSGSGELDNGMTVSFALQLDGDEADDGVIDNHSVTIDTNGMGTIVFAGHGGTGVLDAWDDITPNAYEEAWDGLTPTTAGTDEVINGFAANDSIGYTSPDFNGITFKASLIPSNTSHNGGVYSDMGVKISPEMVEGLSIGYAQATLEDTATTEIDHENYWVKYAVGGFTLGYQNIEASGSTADKNDESTSWGVSYAVNDDMTIAYGEREYNDDTSSDSTTVEQQDSGFSVSYTMGGMTVAGHMNSNDNVRGSTNVSADKESYEFALTFAF